jgi:hypothetical protein
MAYDHTKYEVQMLPVTVSGALATTLDVPDLGATGVKARWAPGLTPHIIHGFSVVPLSTGVLADPVHLSLRGDISQHGTPTEMLKIVLPTTRALAGCAWYDLATYKIQVDPGRQVHLAVTAASAGLRAHVILAVSPSWEEPGNVTGLIPTT